MKQVLKMSCLLALALHLPARADDRLEGMKQMNAQGCIAAIQFEEHAPKDPKQVKPYCDCVYESYFNGFTPAEQRQLFSGSALPEALQKSLPPRLEKSQAQCRKKMGF